MPTSGRKAQEILMFDWTATRTLPKQRETPVDWVRVGRDFKCPVCERTDWCTVASDKTIACCMRVESKQECKNGGWIHELDHKLEIDIPARSERQYDLDAPAEWAKYQSDTDLDMFKGMARQLGLSTQSMKAAGFIWSNDRSALACPMYDIDRTICGIRVRYKWGAKRSVSGGKNGLFIPDCLPDLAKTLWVCEGPTDLAALLDMGIVNCIGTPSAMGGVVDLTGFIRNQQAVERVHFIADMDPVGVRGAKRNAAVLKDMGYTTKVVIPPAKDVRVWMQSGATAGELASLEAINSNEMDQG